MHDSTDIPFPTEDNLPLTETAPEGESHEETEDWDKTEEAPHPADPATYPIPPQPALSTFVALSAEELAEKGKQLAKKLIAIEGLEEERKDINHQIKDLDDEVVKLRNALISGTVEVMTEQQDLLRAPVGQEAAAAQFSDMAREAEAAGQEAGPDVDALNAEAEATQAAQGVPEPSEAFQNDVENFKAKAAAKRKGKK